MINKKVPATDIEERSHFIDTFPSFAFTREKTVAICDQPQANPSDLNRLIHLDPILFGKMQFIYSCFYPRHKSEYISIAKIITMLHINTVRNYAREAALISDDSGAAELRTQERRLSRAFVRAYSARLLAAEKGVEPEKLQQYYAAGLMFYFENYVSTGNKKTAADKAAKYWGFSQMLHDVLKYKNSYKKYEGAYKHILYTAAAADTFANTLLKHSSQTAAPKQNKQVLEYLGFDEKIFTKIKPHVMSEMKKQMLFLKGTP